MLGNIVDHRSDRSSPECDVVFQPSAHDSARRPDGLPWFELEEAEADSAYFLDLTTYDTTVRSALLDAEEMFAFAVTVAIYDKGSLARPIDNPVIKKYLATRKHRN